MSSSTSTSSSVLRSCKACGARFTASRVSQVYCSLECRTLYYGPERHIKTCNYCGIEFSTPHRRKAFCTEKCRESMRHTQERNHKKERGKHTKNVSRVDQPSVIISKIPKGHYVYAWFRNKEVLPFYVGMGLGYRAWDRHIRPDTGCPQACEMLRITASSFEVRIIRKNLTEEGARLVEAVLISFLMNCGCRLSNQLDGMSRQEVPPLSLD